VFASSPFFLAVAAVLSCQGKLATMPGADGGADRDAEPGADRDGVVTVPPPMLELGPCPGRAVCPVLEHGSARGPLRAALVWQTGGLTPSTSTIGHVVAAESAPIEPTFPAHFRIELADRPPDAAIGDFRADVTFQSAIAHVVVYEDANGRFDLIPAGSEEAIDHVVAADAAIGVEFYDGAPEAIAASPYFQSMGLGRGYNLVDRGASPVGPECVTTPCALTSRPPSTLPMSSELLASSAVTPLGLASSCEDFQGTDSSMGDITTPCPQAIPFGSGRICIDRTHMLVAMFETPFPPCAWRSDGKLRYCGVILDPGATPSADWPCQ
jgi:hypothetical protein